MEHNFQIFNYNNNQIRVVNKNGEPWFVAKDVCDILGLGNVTEALRSLERDELTSKVLKSGGQNREVKLVSESGLYNLIFRSYKTEAKKFRRWVTHDVLPDIRKHGMYISDKVQNMAYDNPEAFEALIKQYLEAKDKIKALETQIQNDKAHTLLGKFVVALQGSISVAEFSNFCTQHGIPNMGRNKTYEFLRNNELVSKQKNHKNKPTLKGIQKGIVNLELRGDQMVFSTRTMITPDGAKYLFAMLFGDEYPIFAQIANGQDKEEAV